MFEAGLGNGTACGVRDGTRVRDAGTVDWIDGVVPSRLDDDETGTEVTLPVDRTDSEPVELGEPE